MVYMTWCISLLHLLSYIDVLLHMLYVLSVSHRHALCVYVSMCLCVIDDTYNAFAMCDTRHTVHR